MKMTDRLIISLELHYICTCIAKTQIMKRLVCSRKAD